MEDFDAAGLVSPKADSDASTIDDASVCDVTPVFDDDFIRSRRARKKAKATEPPVEDDSLPQDGLTEAILDSGVATTFPWKTPRCACPMVLWGIAISCVILVPWLSLP